MLQCTTCAFLAASLGKTCSGCVSLGRSWQSSSEINPPSWRAPVLRAGCRGRGCVARTFINGFMGCLDFPHVWPSQFPVLDLFPSCQIPSFLLFIFGLAVWVIDFNFSAWNVPSVCLLERSQEKKPKSNFLQMIKLKVYFLPFLPLISFLLKFLFLNLFT